MCDRNAEYEFIQIILCALALESICERTTEFHEKILFDSGVINLCFQYSVAYCNHLAGSDVVLRMRTRSAFSRSVTWYR